MSTSHLAGADTWTRSLGALLLAAGCSRVPPAAAPAPAAPTDRSPCAQTVVVDGVTALPLACPPFGERSTTSPPQPKDGLVLPASYSFLDDHAGCAHALPTVPQGDCNACWAFSVAGLLSTRACKATHGAGRSAPRVLSPQMVLSCTASAFPRTNGCGATGGKPAEALAWLMGHHVLDETCVPYLSTSPPDASDPELAAQCPDMLRRCPEQDGFTVSAAGYVIGDEEAMKRAIYRSGPIASIVRLPASLYDFAGGQAIFAMTKADIDRFSIEDACDEKVARKRPIPGYCYVNGKDGARKSRTTHVVLVFGWGEDPSTREPYWIVRNWWGEGEYALWADDPTAMRHVGRLPRAATGTGATTGAPPPAARPLAGPFLRMKRGIDPGHHADAAAGLITNPSFLVTIAPAKRRPSPDGPTIAASATATPAPPGPAASPERVAATEPAANEPAASRWARGCKRLLGDALAEVTRADPAAARRREATITKTADGTVIVMASIPGERPLEGLEAAAALWDHDVPPSAGWSGGVRNQGRVGGTITRMKDAPPALRDRFEAGARRALERCMETQPKP